MFDDYRVKRLSRQENKLEKIMKELGPELSEYFCDSKLTRMLKGEKSNRKNAFSVGDEVCVNGMYGIVTYGPYHLNSKRDTYEIEIDGGEIITVENNGKNIEKYTHIEEIEEEDDFFS